MAALDITQYPDPLLRQQAAGISVFDDTLARLANDLFETLYCSSGIGLCAPQVGHSVQLLVMDLSDDHSAPEVFVNPVIIDKAGFAIADESCLSIPGITAKVIRSGVVQIEARDLQGKPFEREYQGMKAICLQHEIDHLQGKLFIDHLSRLRKIRFRRTLQALEGESRPALQRG